MTNDTVRLLWTDGSAKPNPGKGGFTVIERIKSKPIPVVMGNTDHTTSIRMEGRALIEALKYVDGDKCRIFTDSKFWINVIKKWAPMWYGNGWRKVDQTEIRNLDLVKELFSLYKQSNADIRWVKGHSRSYFNHCADIYTKRARLGLIEDNLN